MTYSTVFAVSIWLRSFGGEEMGGKREQRQRERRAQRRGRALGDG
tara:strand:- start:104 stop:238 length:135 start_codon:yes stop_codon:yes gene_type:complete